MNGTTTRISENMPNRTWNDIRFAAETACLLEFAPAVFVSGVVALKGGTGINRFWRDMPRLSNDPDPVFRDGTVLRDEAMRIIGRELERPAVIVRGRGLQTQTSGLKLLLSKRGLRMKVKVNTVMRSLASSAAALFGRTVTVSVLAEEEIHAGKFVAALSRQHPRDLFDVRQFFRCGALTERFAEGGMDRRRAAAGRGL